MFENKIAVVTGGTGALGKAVVNKLSDSGITIYVPVLSVDKFKTEFDNSGSDEYKLRRIFAFQCDAENKKEVKDFVENVMKLEGKIDYLVNTIGGFHAKKNIAEMDFELLDKMLKLNFFSTFNFCRHILPHMIKSNFGRVVAVSAKAGLEITPGKFAYSVSKSAVINLIQTIAEESKELNLTANVIAPAIIDTPANRESMSNSDFNKWTSLEDIAETILFLISDGAKTFRGNVIKMYGNV